MVLSSGCVLLHCILLLTDSMRNDMLECSAGTLPHVSLRLQQPPSNSSSSSSRSSFRVHQTCLLTPAAASQAPYTLAAVCSVLYPKTNAVITYDMETQRAKRLLAGHTREVTDIAAAPAAWFGAQHVFATASKSGDVKIWDVRSKGSAAAITLAGADNGSLEAVALVSNNATSSSSSDSGQLGAGVCCFAGGTGQSVWAWDLRGGQGQALYELSTGNLDVDALAWHQASSSLIVSCNSTYKDRWVPCSWMKDRFGTIPLRI
jgi:WD40 repeat protein